MVQNYYPFGENMGDTTMNYSISPTNNYKYSDNEWQPELNLNTYDFDARHYDPILGRFLGIDALAEESEDWSPYNYVENSPMNLIDPDGMQPSNGNWLGVPFGSGGGSGGSLFGQFGGYGGSAISGVSGFVGGLSAFNINKPVSKTNWSGLGKVQGNPAKPYDPSGSIIQPTNPGYRLMHPDLAAIHDAAYNILDAFGLVDLTNSLGEVGNKSLSSGYKAGHIVRAVVGVVSIGEDGEVGPLNGERLGIEPYNREAHYGKTPTKADRKALGADNTNVVDHDPPLVQRYHEGDPSIGEKPGYKMTDAEKKSKCKR